MAKPFLAPGPVPGTSINSPGELDALVASAQPGADHGMTYRDTTAPDIATYPIYANFIWIDTSGPSVIKRTYNTSLFTWDAEVPGNDSITGDMIQDNTITLDKIYATAGLGGYVMRLNAGSTAVIWDAPANLYTNNSFAVAKLTYSTAGTFVLSSTGAANTWATIPSLLATGDIALSKLSTSGALSGQVIYYNGAALAYGYPDQLLRTNEVGLNALELSAGNNIPTINSAGTAWEMKTPSQFAALFTNYFAQAPQSSSLITVPASEGTAITPITHGLGGVPRNVRWVMVCDSSDAGYPDDMEVDLANFFAAGGGDSNTAWTTFASVTEIGLRRVVWVQTLSVGHYTTGAVTGIDTAKWKLRCYYSL